MTDKEIEPFLSIINPTAGPSISQHYRSQRDTGLVEALDDELASNDGSDGEIEAEHDGEDDEEEEEEGDDDEESMQVDGEEESPSTSGRNTRSKSKLAKFAKGEIDFAELKNEIYREEEGSGDVDEPDDIAGKPKSRGKRGKRNDLDGMGSALLGHAELSFAKGLRDDAIQMVLQVIKERPYAYEPYQTIAYYYEQKIADEPDLDEKEKESLREKSLQFYLLGAHLNKTDGDNWWDVAKKYQENRSFETAAFCFEMAAKYSNNKGDILDCLKSKAEILEFELKNISKAIATYAKLLDEINVTNRDQGDFALRYTRKLATLHFNNGQPRESIAVCEKYFLRFEEYLSSEEVNMYIDLVISEACYAKALIAFSTYCAVEYSVDDCDEVTPAPKPLKEEWFTNNCDRLLAKPIHSSTFPIDFTAKLIVCLISMKATKSVEELEQSLLAASELDNSDLFLDVADAYIRISDYAKAESWLCKVMKNPEFKEKVAIWLRYARCLKFCERENEAICAYFTCLRLSPNHLEVKHEVCRLLVKKERFSEATTFSEQALDGSIIANLLVIRCNLVYAQNDLDTFIESAKVLLMYDIHSLTKENEFMCVIRSSNHKNRMESLRDEWKRDAQVSSPKASRPHFIGDTPEPTDILDILKKLSFIYWKQHKFDELRKLVFSAYTSYVMSSLDSSLDFIAMNAIYLMKDTKYVYPFFKALAQRTPLNNQLWNIFCPIMARLVQDLRHNRFCLRILAKNSDYLPLRLFNAHNAHMSGSYMHALAEYMDVYKERPDDPFVVFCICVSYAHLISQKFTLGKNSLVIQLCAFLDRYIELRGECQESLYNTARALHQIGLLHDSIPFYKRALALPPSISETNSEEFDLTREIAYNLAHIYQSSGNSQLSRMYRKKYCVI